MVFLVSRGNVLMLKKPERENDPNSGYFTFPGGKLKDNEKGLRNIDGRFKCAEREMKEETTGMNNLGIKLINPVLRGVVLFDNKGRTFSNWKNPDDFLVYVISATEFKGCAEESDEGIPYSVPLNKMNKLQSNSGDKKLYEWLKDGRNFFGVIKHKGNEVDEAGTMVDFF